MVQRSGRLPFDTMHKLRVPVEILLVSQQSIDTFCPNKDNLQPEPVPLPLIETVTGQLSTWLSSSQPLELFIHV